MNTERQEILRKLMHTPRMSFNELWGKEGASNKFAYHLKVLEEDGMVAKDGEVYSLTIEGKKYCMYVDGASGVTEKKPLLTVSIVVYDKNTDKFLLQKRLKEPFYGLWGMPGGKVGFDEFLLETGHKELKEETGLECDQELKALHSVKTFHKGELAFNNQLFLTLGTNPSGKLLEKTREGENAWFSLDEMKDLKMFPIVAETCERVRDAKQFYFLEANRQQDDTGFTGFEIMSLREL